eukprot:PhF_6_TR43578/c0_g1_i1/m.66929
MSHHKRSGVKLTPETSKPIQLKFDERVVARCSKYLKHVCRDYLFGRCQRTECKFEHSVPPELTEAQNQFTAQQQRSSVTTPPSKEQQQPAASNAKQKIVTLQSKTKTVGEVKVLQSAAPLTQQVASLPSNATTSTALQSFQKELQQVAQALTYSSQYPTVKWTHCHYFDSLIPNCDHVCRQIHPDCAEYAIVALAGPQRSGKTTLLIDLCKELIGSELSAQCTNVFPTPNEIPSRHGSIAVDAVVVTLFGGAVQILFLDCTPLFNGSLLHNLEGSMEKLRTEDTPFIKSKEHYLLAHDTALFVSLLSLCDAIHWVTSMDSLRSMAGVTSLLKLRDLVQIHKHVFPHHSRSDVSVLLTKCGDATNGRCPLFEKKSCDRVLSMLGDCVSTVKCVPSTQFKENDSEYASTVQCIAENIVHMTRKCRLMGSGIPTLRERISEWEGIHTAILRSPHFISATSYTHG